MTLNEEKLVKFYLLGLLLCVYLPTFQVYDKSSAQYFFISILNTVSLFVVPIYIKKIDLKVSFRQPLLIFYLAYIIISVLSIISAINIAESFVKIFQLITFFISLSFISLFAYKQLIKTDFLLIIIALSLLVDMFYSFAGYIPFLINGIDYTYSENNRLVGLYGNRNILATILCFKIPFVILLAIRKRVTHISILSFIVITMAFFNITLLSSRATYLSIILCVIFLLLTLFLLYKKNLDLRYYLKNTLFFLIPLIAALVISFYSIDSKDEGAVLNRISSITSTNDVSKNTRLRYYEHAFTHTLKNPFLGGGIGNWKIVSLKYDSEDIKNYIIPYNAHNDVLEAFAETGIIGGLSFLLFFLSIPYFFLKNLKEKLLDQNEYTQSIILFLPFIIYFVDLNLNFPSARPSNQVVLLLYIAIVMITQLKINDKT